VGWQDDLLDLLEGTDPGALAAWASQPLQGPAQAFAESGVGQALGQAGGVLSGPFGAVGNVLNAPLTGVKMGTGALIGGINRLALEHPNPVIVGEQATEEAFSRGGPMAAWEQTRSDEPLIFQAATELGLDPLTLAGIGKGFKPGIEALTSAAQRADNPAISAALRASTVPLRATQALNDLPGRALEGRVIRGHEFGIQPGVRKLKGGIEKVAPNAFKLADDEYDALLRDKLRQANVEAVSQYGPAGPPPPSAAMGGFPAAARKARQAEELAGMSQESIDLMAQPLRSGETFHEFLTTAEDKITEDIQKLNDSGVTWPPQATAREREAAARASTDPDALAIVRRYNKENLDPLNAASPRQMAQEQLLRQVAKDEGRQYAHSTVPSLIRSAWGEIALTSPHYQFGNMVGNTIQLAMDGTNPVVGWREYQKAWKAARAGIDTVTGQEILSSLNWNDVWRRYGYDQAPDWMFRGGMKTMTYNPSRYAKSATGEMIGRATGNETLARKGAYLIDLNNDTANAIDWVARGTKGTEAFDEAMRPALATWEAEVQRRLPTGVDYTSPPDGMSKDAIKTHIQSLGATPGDAEHLSRTYINIRGKAADEARTATNKVIFAGDRTNFERKLGKFVPFTYWYSRAMRYYWENTLRHPALLANYLRLQDGIDDAQEDPGLDGRQKGFLHLLNTGLGFSLLMNPDALFGVTKILNLDNDYEADGTTKLGGVLNWMRGAGIGAYPWIDQTMNMMGVYGNTFEPDLLSLPRKALVGSALNFVNAHTGGQPLGSPYADAMGQARFYVSSLIDPLVPDALAMPVVPKAGGSQQAATLDNIIENILYERHPGITNEEMLRIVSNPDDPEYEQAYMVASDSGVIKQLMNFVAPVQFTMRHDQHDRDAAAANAVREEANKLGVPPFKLTPAITDLEFAAKYEKLTGKPWTPTNYMEAKARYDFTRTPNEAKPFLIKESVYNQLGTERQRRLNSRYQAIRNGDDPLTSGVQSEVVREQLAGEWLTKKHGYDTVQDLQALRNTYESTNVDFGAFKTWQSSMYHLRDQLGGSLEQYRQEATRQNPNAAAYYARTAQWIREQYPDDLEKQRQMLDDQTLNSNAYQAIMGIGTLRAEPGAVPGAPKSDVTLPQFQSSMMPPPLPDWMQHLRQMGGGGPF
jgi:hypothetical protein